MKKPPEPFAIRSRIVYPPTGYPDPDEFPALAAEDVKAFFEDVIRPAIAALPSELSRSHYYVSGQRITEGRGFVDELHQQAYRAFALGLVATYERQLREYLLWYARALRRDDLEESARKPRGVVVEVLAEITGFAFERRAGVLRTAILWANVWRHGPGSSLNDVYKDRRMKDMEAHREEAIRGLPHMYAMRLDLVRLALLARSIQRVWEVIYRSKNIRYMPKDARQA